ncbi:glycosyltransferase family 2 protein [Vibrio floridensis]|uniref:glycosyltransferase family 2 protein n=1 Tax=Vibrio floridensis TaxID=2908007 RepID=UPI003B007680
MNVALVGSMNTMELTLLLTFVISSVLIVYHHAGYPLLLKWLAKRQQQQSTGFSAHIESKSQRHYRDQLGDADLPTITVLVPAYNEAAWIAEKIRNLAALDYPTDKLKVVIACDGCCDNTVEIAQDTIQEAICSEVLFEIHDHPINRGKVAVINHEMASICSDITAISDVSALISVDSLLLAAAHFDDPKTGVVNACYRMLCNGGSSEEAYWRYQTQIKATEASIGSSIGSHGAFYLFRTALFTPLALNTINDDFVLPMLIVKKGHKADYETRMVAIELEASSTQQDFARRLRISAGNMQQLIQLASLLNPKFGGTAFTLFSGKGLRLLTPYLMLLCLLSSLLLSHYFFFALMLTAQWALYGTALIGYYWPKSKQLKPVNLIHYLVVGHFANLTGGLRYLLGKENGQWSRINQNGEQL